ncbi:Ig-like domain-containing protein [Paenibacillus sp. CMAA1364]
MIRLLFVRRNYVKRVCSFLLVLVLLSSCIAPLRVTAAPVPQAAVNLVTHSSFEEVSSIPTSIWKLYLPASNPIQASIHTSDAKSGTNALKITLDTLGKSGSVYQNIPVIGDQTYKISFWMKSDYSEGTRASFYTRDTASAKNMTAVAMGRLSASEIDQWIYVEDTVTTPINTATLVIGAVPEYNNGVGTTLYDDFKVEAWIPVTAISLDQTNVAMEPHQTVQLQPTVTPVNASNPTLTWSSSNPTVASVDQSGQVTGLQSGSTIVTATSSDGVSATTSIQVTENNSPTPTVNLVTYGSFEEISSIPTANWKLYSPPPHSVQVSINTSDAKEGTHSLGITLDALGQSGSVYQNIPVTSEQKYKISFWMKSNYVEGSRAGLYTKNTAGTKNMTSISMGRLSPAEVDQWIYVEESMTTPPDTGTLVIEAVPEYNKGIGTTLYDDFKVEAWIPVTTIILDQTNVTVNPLQTVQLQATITPLNASNQTLVWSSSNSAVATVDQSGQVTALQSGTTTITATSSDGVSATSQIAVDGTSVPVTGVDFYPTKHILAVGDSLAITPIVLPSNASNQDMIWLSSNPLVATVINGQVTAVGKGHTTISATSVDGDIESLVDVSVSNLIKDGTIETSQDLQGKWRSYDGGAAQKFEASVDSTVARSGQKSLRVYNNVGGSGSVYQSIPLTGGKNYRLSAWLKSALQTASGDRITYYFKNAIGTKISSTTYLSLPVEEDPYGWRYIEKSDILAPSSATSMTLAVYPNSGSSVTWYDDLALEEWNAVSSIVIDHNNVVLSPNEELQLSATVLPNNASNQTVQWMTSDAAVASVDQTGKVTAHTNGMVFITAMSGERGIHAITYIQVGQAINLTAIDQTVVTPFGKEISGIVNATNSNAQPLIYSKLAEASHGTVTVLPNGQWTYTPEVGFEGTDTFRVAVADNATNFTSSKVTVTVVSMNNMLLPFENQHPRLYLDDSKITSLQSSVSAQGMHKDLWTDLIARADSNLFNNTNYRAPDASGSQNWMRDIGNQTVDFAFTYLLSNDPKYLVAAKKFALASSSYPTWGAGELANADLPAGHQLFSLGVTYDWLYDELSPAEKKSIRDAIIARGSEMYAKAIGNEYNNNIVKAYWEESYLHNHLWVNLGGLTAAALAVYDYDQETRDIVLPWLKLAYEKFDKTHQVLADDGASPEGFSYWQYGMEWLIKYGMLSDTFFGVDTLQNEWYKQGSTFASYMMMPEDNWVDGVHHLNLADDPGVSWYGPNYLLHVLAAKHQDGVAQWLGNKVFEKDIGTRASSWLGVLYFDPTVIEVPRSTLPTAHRFNDMEIAIARSDWSKTSSMVAYKNGPYLGHNEMLLNTGAIENWGSGHVHPDANHFMVYSNGEYLLRDDGYADKITANHNTLIMNGHGQMGEGSRWFQMFDPHAAKATPSISAEINTEEFDYWSGDGAEAYNLEVTGLEKFRRHMIFIKPSTLIVVDDIAADRTSQMALQFFPESENIMPVGTNGDSYLAISNHNLMKFQSLTPSAADVRMEAVPYRHDDSSATTRKAFRVIGENKTNLQNAVAFTWSNKQGSPETVQSSRVGNLWTFEVGGKAVQLDMTSHTVTSVSPSGSGQSSASTELLAISMNGQPLENYNPTVLNYQLEKQDKNPNTVIEVIKASSTAIANIDYSGSVPGIATITVSDEGLPNRQYTIHISKGLLLPVVSAQSNGTTGFDPNLAFDDDMTTIWSAKKDPVAITDNPDGYAWLIADLGKTEEINKTAIAWYLGHQRVFNFDVEVSEDGLTWTNVGAWSSNGLTDDYEQFNFDTILARYVKVWTKSNSTGGAFNSIKEMNIYSTGNASVPEEEEPNVDPPVVNPPNVDPPVVGSPDNSTGHTLPVDSDKDSKPTMVNGFAEVTMNDNTSISLRHLVDLNKSDPNAVIRIVGTHGTMTFPIAAINFKQYAEDAKLHATIVPVKEPLVTQAEMLGMQWLNQPVNVTLTIQTGSKLHDVSNLQKAVTFSFNPAKEMDHQNAVVVWLNEDTGEVFPILFKKNKQGNPMTLSFSIHKSGSYGVIIRNKSPLDALKHWAKKDLAMISNKLILVGKLEENIKPNRLVTRAELAEMMSRLLGMAGMPNPNPSPFKDIADGYYANAIHQLYANQLMNGFTDNTFRSDEGMTREQMALFIARVTAFAGKPLSDSNDKPLYKRYQDHANVAGWASSAVSDVIYYGLMVGTARNEWKPKENLTLAEGAVILNRLLDYLDLK